MKTFLTPIGLTSRQMYGAAVFLVVVLMSHAVQASRVWGGIGRFIPGECPYTNQWETSACGCTNIPAKPPMNAYDYEYTGQDITLYSQKGCKGDVIDTTRGIGSHDCLVDWYQAANSVKIDC